MELTTSFSADAFAAALDSWSFLPLAGKSPAFASLFGDVFLSDADGWWWLDTLEGTLTKPWTTTEAMTTELETEEGQDHYLMAGLAFAAAENGLTLVAGQVYGFIVPPVLGGRVELANVEVTDFVVTCDIAGQIRAQVRELPPGTRVASISVDGRSPVATTQRRRFFRR